jgi:hypothetical protein
MDRFDLGIDLGNLFYQLTGPVGRPIVDNPTIDQVIPDAIGDPFKDLFNMILCIIRGHD